ncbi:MAG: hypothetical protein ACI9UR_001015 [Bacteroidia bacterium]|jgi:hypothetical protein
MGFGKENLVYLIITGAIFMTSCKEKDSISPTVTISLPNQGQIFNVFDTVVTRFSVTEETRLKYVFTQIVDANFIPIGPSIPVNFSGTSFTGNVELVLDDKLLPTADYYVLVTASDGVNETREFREIKIAGVPKKRRAVFFSTAGQSNLIWKIDSLFQGGFSWLAPNQDIRQICVNSLNDRLIFIGQLSTEIKAFDINSIAMIWSDNTSNVNQIQRFTDLMCYENSVYTGLFDKEIRAYNLNGALNLNRTTGNYRPEAIYVDQTYLVIEMQLVGDDSHHVFVHSSQTHSLLWQLEVPMNIEAICPLQGDELLLFGNDAGQAKVLHYDIGDNGWWEPRNLPAGILSDAVHLEGLNFAIAHESGLYSYTYNPNFLNMLSADNYQDIVFDVDNNTVIGAVQNTVNEVSVVNGAMINSFAQADSITSIDIHYTR